MNADIVFRPLSLPDSESVEGLERIIFSTEAWTADLVEEELSCPWAHYVGAFVGDTLVGYAGAKGELEIDVMTVGVHPDFRGRAIGWYLVENLISWAGERPMFLEVRASNDAAIRLYEKAGFSKLGRVRRYYRNPVEDAVTMVRQ